MSDSLQFAKNSINRMVADLSVPNEETINRLEELKEHVEVWLNTVKEGSGE